MWPLPVTESKRNFNDPNSKTSSPNNGNIKRTRKTFKRKNQYQVEPFRNVINLSEFSFTKHQYKPLNKNFNFFPHQKNIAQIK